jgi:hypothetical protein
MRHHQAFKFLVLLGSLQVLTGCALDVADWVFFGDKKTCDESIYSRSRVGNHTGQGVSLRFCSGDLRYSPTVALIPSGRETKDIDVKMQDVHNTYRLSQSESCGNKSLEPEYNYDTYASLSAPDRADYHLCQQAPRPHDTVFNNGIYLILNVGEPCPATWVEFNQDANPC